ncbi:AAA family ATPase [Microbacterium sp. LRZ72]|uniref:AAA family ATPase n=1 Tax=Microbacterium sp. LRZ72 TaxID=2942481 RepID=UPI0029A0AF0A|nr:AAA family ATPase [Microbacterium sp. LRZ72]MDX2375625.1 AAA family ATPase [Microbacterium sp. LRZ72]
MRLVKAIISGFGRIADGTINLDNKVIAIVGPNEAGKTTLLNALAFLDNEAALSPSERSRGIDVPDNSTVVRVQYILDDDDRAAVAHYGLEEPPTSIWLSRKASGEGGVRRQVVPAPRKAVVPLEAAIKTLRSAHTKRAISQLAFVPPEADEEGNVPPVDPVREALQQRVDSVLRGYVADSESDGTVAATDRWADELRAVLEELNRFGLAEPLGPAIGGVLTWIDREDPRQLVAEALYNRAPNILLFSEADRNLGSVHMLSDELCADPPAALANLAGMAELDLPALWATYSSGDEGERETLIDAANRTLATKFAKAWKQSDITVVLKTERTALSIRIKQDGKRITQFDERSAGLKMFVALVAFLAVRDEHLPPVLLIDEAETHLHIDAQADLVNAFMTQQQAAKIIYTTHSPACLPPDLGSNIRAVVPDPANEYRSLIQGSFWAAAAGFSPLLLAMGAGAAAFSTARYVVLGEGASEMLMLPSLVKRAVDVPDLEYQVAPGLSEVAPEMYPELDLAGARVAYLVDGDQGGVDRRAALIAGGVPEERIVSLTALTLENLLEPDSYLGVVGFLLAECNPGVDIPALPALPAVNADVWPAFLDRWAKQKDLKMPGKRIVASRLVEEGHAVPSEYGRPILKRAHNELERVLRSAGRRGKSS